MTLNFITADQRLATKRSINLAIVGPSGAGKTTLARSLDPKTTLFINAESGDLALGDWPGTILNIREDAVRLGMHPWELCRGISCLLSGPNPAASTDSGRASFYYGKTAFDHYSNVIGPPSMFDAFGLTFWDSITVASRWSFSWSQTTPDAFSDKGKYDGRGVYGRHGQEMIEWLTSIQHTPNKSTVVVGILDEELDEFKRPIFSPQIEGSKTGRELPGIFDEIVTLGLFKIDNGNVTLDLKKGDQRAFVCQPNPWGVPGKDRSGTLSQLEPPNLGALIAKMQAGVRVDGQLNFNPPSAPAAV